MPTISIDQEKCKGCLLCVGVCPRGLIRQGREINEQGYQYVVLEDAGEECTACTACALMCPDICIEVYR